MKDKISSIAKALGITPQAIHLYEERGILQFQRDQESGYRIFGRPEIVLLMHSRALRNYGFSLPEIAEIFNDLSAEEVLDRYRERQEALEEEIRRLQEQKAHLAHLEQDSREALERAGTCEVRTSRPCWLYPFLDGPVETHEIDLKAIQPWIDFSPLRWDTILIRPKEVHQDVFAYRPAIVLEEETLPLLPPELREKLIYRPAQQTVYAWFFREHSSDQPPQRNFAFVLHYLEEQGLVLNGDVLLSSLLLLHRSSQKQVYFQAQFPVEVKKTS